MTFDERVKRLEEDENHIQRKKIAYACISRIRD